MRIKTCIVYSVGDYLEAISQIEKTIKEAKERENEENKEKIGDAKPTVLWFRGLSDINHTLVPSLFRQSTRVTSTVGDYSTMHYAEDIRTQHYIAKNFHFLGKEPSSRVEWLEVMQHHEMNTRALDWSESSIHSLIFALEAFINDRRYSDQDRSFCVPCVWVLEPGELNKKIFGYLSKQIEAESELVHGLIRELQLSVREQNELLQTIKKFGHEELQRTAETSHLDYIFNLSVINDEILRDRNRIKALLCKGDILHPYYYLLSRIYADGKILDNRDLPPLAVVQPYHSERIKAQKGVFTIFPFYREKSLDDAVRKMTVNPDAMENNGLAEKCLYKIILSSPQKIAYELMANGMNNSWLYPEMPIVANELERRKIH